MVRTIWERFGNDVLLSAVKPVHAGARRCGASWGCVAQRQLQRCPELGGRVSDGEYEELLDYADSLGIEDYFWQQGGAAKDSFIPAFDLTGVPR